MADQLQSMSAMLQKEAVDSMSKRKNVPEEGLSYSTATRGRVATSRSKILLKAQSLSKVAAGHTGSYVEYDPKPGHLNYIWPNP